MNVRNRASKLDQKMGSFIWFPYFLSKLWALYCPKKCIFCNFVLTSARNISLLKQFTYRYPKDLVTHFQKMVIVYYAIAYCFRDVRLWIQKILLNFCWISIFFWYFNCSDLMNGGSDPCKPYHFLKECSENFQIEYVNCFTRLRSLPEVNTKLQKMHFYSQSKDHNSGRKLETRQITPFFI